MRVSTLSLIALAAAACGTAANPPPPGNDTGDDNTQKAPLEIAGEWVDAYGLSWTITQDHFGADAIVSFDDKTNVALTHQPATDPYNPNKFAKLQWTDPKADGWWFCTVDFGLATEADAKASTKTADPADPANGGCGGFPWTHMAARLEVTGEWVDNYGGRWVLSNAKWGTDTVAKFDNAARFAITQAPHDDPYNPDKFSKWAWTAPKDGGFWVCTVDFGKASAAEAEATTKTADATDPANGGCGGFPWSRYEPAPPAFELIGDWTDNYGGSWTITQKTWGPSDVVSYDDDANTAVLKAPHDDPFNPDTFSKWVWTEPKDGTFWVCTVDFALATQTAAQESTKTADASNPAEGGCAGFPWTKMTKKTP